SDVGSEKTLEPEDVMRVAVKTGLLGDDVELQMVRRPQRRLYVHVGAPARGGVFGSELVSDRSLNHDLRDRARRRELRQVDELIAGKRGRAAADAVERIPEARGRVPESVESDARR